MTDLMRSVILLFSGEEIKSAVPNPQAAIPDPKSPMRGVVHPRSPDVAGCVAFVRSGD
jgi:hypothetical protein